jgi:hypothetical protein
MVSLFSKSNKRGYLDWHFTKINANILSVIFLIFWLGAGLVKVYLRYLSYPSLLMFEMTPCLRRLSSSFAVWLTLNGGDNGKLNRHVN